MEGKTVEGKTVNAESRTAQLVYDGKTYDLPVVSSVEGEIAIDISRLRADTGMITLDPGYANTGACRSAITFIDGEKGILRYRGYPIEDLAEKSTFLEVAWLLIYGELPSYRRVLDGSGAEGPADVAIVGSEGSKERRR